MAKKSNETSKSVIQLVVDGKAAETSVRQLGTALNYVNNELRNMKANDPLRADLLKQKQQISAEYTKQKTLIGDIRSGWSKFKDEFMTIATGVVGGNMIMFVVQQLIMLIPQLINKAMELRDSLADVAKATDMTDTEVKALNQELKGFNTRTATKELRDMAKVGGQFGVAKDQIAGFVKGADKVNVALGDQFGSAEATAGAVLKLRNIFGNLKTTDIEKDLLHIGNALNVLEAKGAATGAGMTDFASRMGGVLIPMKVSEAQILGLSATLEELNTTAERGSTATVDIFQRMLTETEAFAKIAKSADGGRYTLEQYRKLIGEDIYGAFLAYLRGLKEIQPNQIAFMAALEEAKLTGAGASEVLGKLSVNQEMLAEKTKLAGDALQNTDSITKEFNKKNHELAVGLKNLGEWWNSLIYSEGLQSFATGVVSVLNTMLGLRDSMEEARKEFKKQEAAVKQLDTALPPLLQKHSELSMKVLTTKKGQEELHAITQKIAEIVPQAVTAWDDYGNAIDIDKKKLEAFIVMQRRAFEEQKKLAKQSLQSELKGKEYSLLQAQKVLERGTIIEVSPTNTGAVSERRMTTEEINAQRAEVNRLQKEIGQTELDIAQLNGSITQQDIDRSNRLNQSPSKPTKTPTYTPPSGDGKDKKEAKKPVDLSMSFETWQETVDGEIEAWNAIDKQVADERKKNIERLHQELLTEYQKLYLALEQQAADGLITEQEYNAQKLDLKQAQLTAEIVLLKSHGEQVIEQEMQLAEIQHGIRQDLADKRIEEATREAQADLAMRQAAIEAERELQQARKDLMADGVEAMKGFVSENTIAFKALFLIQKAMAIADVITKATQEQAAYGLAIANLSASASMGNVAAMAGIGAITTKMLASKVRAAGAIALIGAQAIVGVAGREQGGSTSMQALKVDNSGQPAGYINEPTYFSLGPRSWIGGEGHKQEYVIPYSMLQDPVVANIAGALEAVRPRYFEQGGSTGMSSSPLAQVLPQATDYRELVEEMRAMRSELKQMKVSFNYYEFEQYQERIQFLRNEASA